MVNGVNVKWGQLYFLIDSSGDGTILELGLWKNLPVLEPVKYSIAREKS